MTPRRPTSNLDAERFMKRIEEKLDARLDLVLTKIGDLQTDILRGNMSTELLTRRVTDIENQVLETRSHMQISERLGARAIISVAEAATLNADSTPKKVWKTKLGMVTAGSAAFVAMVAFFSNVPKFVRGASVVIVNVYNFIIGAH